MGSDSLLHCFSENSEAVAQSVLEYSEQGHSARSKAAGSGARRSVE